MESSYHLKWYIATSAAMIFFFATAAIAFSLLMPPFENPDELEHVAYVIHIANHWNLPRVTWDSPGVFEYEAMQTPLYYISAAPFLTAPPETARPVTNPAFHFAPAPPGMGPHRLFLPITKSSSSYLRAMADACRQVRFVSIVWGLVAAITASALLWTFAKGNGVQAALGLVIFLFNPRWIEAASSASNDVAASATATVALLLMMCLFRKEEITWKDCAALGMICAISTLTKLNNAGLIILGIIVLASKTKPARTVPLFVVISILPLIPWMMRNYLLYGDFFAINSDLYRHLITIRDTPLGLIRFFKEEFQGFRWSYFAVFGQFALLADPPVYSVLDAFLFVSGISATTALIADFRSSKSNLERLIVLFPLLWIGIISAEFASYNHVTLSSQGRLIYPASTCIAYLLARGCLWLTPAKARIVVAIVVSGLFATFAFYVVFSVLPRGYRQGF